MLKKNQFRFFFPIVFALTSPVWCNAQDVAVTFLDSFRLPSEVTALAFSSDGRNLIAGDKKGNIQEWNLEQRLSSYSGKCADRVVFISFLGDDRSYVCVDTDGNVSVTDLNGIVEDRSFRAASSPLHASLDASRTMLAIGTKKDRIELFDVKNGRRVGSIDSRDELKDIIFVGFDRLGSQVVAMSSQAEVVSWNPVTLRPLRQMKLSSGELHGSETRIHQASTNQATNIFIAGLEEVALPTGGVRPGARPGDLLRRDLIAAYDWNTGIELKRFEYSGGEVNMLAMGPGNDHAIVANRKNESVTVIDLRKGEIGSSVALDAEPATLMVSGDGNWLAVGAKDGAVTVWSLSFRGLAIDEDLSNPRPTLSGRIRVVGDNTPILAGPSQTTLAILPFEDRGESENIASTITEILTTRLANVDHLRLVERIRISSILDEFALQDQGITEANGLEIGKMLNADYVLLGSISELGSTYMFAIRMLNVETTEVVSGRQVICEECRPADLFDAINLLGSTIARTESN